MNNLNTRHAGTAAGAGLVAAVAVEAVLPFLSRAIHAGPAVLLAPAIVIFLDIRWRLGVGPELRRAAFRESRCTWLRSGACQNKPSEVERWLNSIGKRVKRAERRVLCSLKLGNLQMRDRRIDHDDLVAAAEDLLEAPAGLRATFPLPIYLPSARTQMIKLGELPLPENASRCSGALHRLLSVPARSLSLGGATRSSGGTSG